jgi:hypothetical protein
MFIVRLWRGDVALVITYWVFGAVGGVALRLLSPAVTYEIMAHSTTMSVFDIQVLLYLWVAFLITYSVLFSSRSGEARISIELCAPPAKVTRHSRKALVYWALCPY